MLFPDAEHGQGQTHFIVEIALRFQDPVSLGEHGGDHLLRAGLSHTAGDTHHPDIQGTAVMLCQVFQRLPAGIHQDIGKRSVP